MSHRFVNAYVERSGRYAGLRVLRCDLDATFLAQPQRAQVRALADELGVRYVILDFRASADTLRERVRQRALRADDASEADIAVLEDQLASAQPLRPDEQVLTFVVDAEPVLDEAAIATRWAPLLRQVEVAPA